MRQGAGDDVYEVFARFGDSPAEPIRWMGNVRAGDPELAWHAAKEIYTRRERCTVLWVAQRCHITMSGPEDAEALRSPSRLGYRVPAFPGLHRRDRIKAAAAASVDDAS